MNTTTLVLLALATWRLASMFTNEDGPFQIFSKIRILFLFHLPGLHPGLECEWCNSIWFGTLLTGLYFLMGDNIRWILLPLALSAVAIGIKYIVQNLQVWQENNTK